jgi:hypothetical protein
VKLHILMLILVSTGYAFAQNSVKEKQLTSTRAVEPPKLDAILNDMCWQGVTITKDLVESLPLPAGLKAGPMIHINSNTINQISS